MKVITGPMSLHRQARSQEPVISEVDTMVKQMCDEFPALSGVPEARVAG
ncbi:MAG: hypothetical protein LYZ70_07940 [Nitrososphaerales archaeon]|nr:hypothetical protein [Nitrososphaerales archaeon]